MPQIQVFDCPSCGASLSYDGGPETTITCQFCGTTVVIPEELRAKSAPPPPVYPGPVYPGAAGQPVSPDQAALIAMLQQLAQHVASASPDRAARVAAALRAVEQMANQGTFYPGAPGQATHVNQAAMAAVESLARAGQMIEAIKVYRLITGAGLQEARDAVVAMTGGGGPPPGPAYAGQYGSRPRRARRAAGCGCLPVLLLVVAGIAVFGYVPYRVSGSYAKVLSTVRANPDIVRALGEPVEADWWLWGSDWSCSGSCSVSYTMGIHGARASGTVDVQGTMKRGGDFFDAASWTVTGAVSTGGRAYDLAAHAAASSGQPTKVPLATKIAPPTMPPVATEPLPTATPDLQATAAAMSGGQGDWALIAPVNAAAPFGKWPTGVRQDDAIAVTTTVQAKSYLMTVFPKHSSSYMNFYASDASPVTDFTAQVDVTFKEGAAGNTYAYGLVFRLVNDDYGFFGVQNDGQFKFLRVRDTGIVDQDIVKSTAVKTGAGQTNRLLVRNTGSDFVFEINGVPVWGFNHDMPAGKVGLGVDVRVKGQPAQVVFGNFEVHAPKP